jgi:hypothetical protein
MLGVKIKLKLSYQKFFKGITVRLLRRFKSDDNANRLVRIANACLLALVLIPIAATERLPASFSGRVSRMVVEIDGVSFGAFTPVKDLDQLVGSASAENGGRIALSRDFVTDPSLYLWANSLMRGNTSLKDVSLISENADGVEVARYVLRMSQPVAWTVEASNPEVGGLHERVEFAVQKVERL